MRMTKAKTNKAFVLHNAPTKNIAKIIKNFKNYAKYPQKDLTNSNSYAII